MPTVKEILLFPFEVIGLTVKIWYYVFEAFLCLLCPPPEKDIQSQVVLITGGGGGIGRALALEFAKHNASLVIWDINKEAAKETAKQVRDQGVTCAAYVCDVTSKADVDRVAQEVLRDVGDVDILVNNAGVFPCKSLIDLSEKEILKTFGVNSLALFWTMKAFLPNMMAKNSGHIVAISSMAGKVGTALCTDYCASKHAAYGMIEAVRQELELQEYSGIMCSVVCPMMVNTPMMQQFADRIHIYDRFGRLYEAPYIAEQAVQRILRNELYIFIPADKSLVGIVLEGLPYKARQAIFRFVNAGFKEIENNKKDS